MHALVDDLVPVGLDLALADILKLLCSGKRGTTVSHVHDGAQVRSGTYDAMFALCVRYPSADLDVRLEREVFGCFSLACNAIFFRPTLAHRHSDIAVVFQTQRGRRTACARENKIKTFFI